MAQDTARVADTIMTREARTAEAKRALAEGDYALAIAQSDALLDRWPKDEQALYFKASALLFGPDKDPAEAGRLLRQLPRSRRNDADVQALDLWKDFQYGINFMPTIRDALQLRRARRLLEEDPFNPIANLVAGMLLVEEQRYLDNAARVGIGLTATELADLLFYEAEPVINPETGSIEFVSRRGMSQEIQMISEETRMREISNEAIRYLIRGSSSGNQSSVSVKYLTEAAIRGGRVQDAAFLLTEFVARYPDVLEGHLYLGLIQYMLVKDDLAAVSFDRAIELMDAEKAEPWLDPRTVVSTSVINEYRNVDATTRTDFWIRQDREWSKPGNERKTEHLGRMAYADLIWGRPEKGFRGWESEPGQVLIRYGFPDARLQFQSEGGSGTKRSGSTGDRFHILHYGDRYWIFQDLVKADEPIFMTPNARAYEGGRAVVLNDWALIAREQFRDNPLESDLDNTGRLNMVTYPSVFENAGPAGGLDSRTVVAPLCIRGDAFPMDSYVKRFERRPTAPVPFPSDSSRVYAYEGCARALSVVETDGLSRQVSHEIRNGSFWSVGRYDIPAAVEGTGVRTSDVLLADLIVEYDEQDGVPEGMFVRNDLLIRPVAEARYDRGQPIFVYAEAYGLDDREGDLLTIQALVAEGSEADMEPSLLGRLFGGRDEAAVSVSFEDEIRAKSHGRYLILETADLQPGSYTLALRFTQRSTGRQAVTRREIQID